MVNGAAASLRLASSSAVLAGELPPAVARAPGVARVGRCEPRRAVSPAASYAVEAAGALQAPLADAALYTFAGPPGSVLHLFDPARETDGRLVSPGFGRDRSRRIHPFALLLGLQNQVASTLSLELGLRGPCTSATDSAAAFADLLPNLALEARERGVLAVFASAADRAEHRGRGIWETGADAVLEGAVALLFTASGELGELSAASDPHDGDPLETATPRSPFAPVLEPALSILAALGDRRDAARIEVREPRRTTAIQWSRR
jgi:hypothetical protein